MDSTVWIAIITGGTAVLAGWVTSQANARAARVQAVAAAEAQDRSRYREMRRAAYLDLIEQAHLTAELYYKGGDVYVQRTDLDEQLAGVQALRTELRNAFGHLRRSTWVVLLEGPTSVSEQADILIAGASAANSALSAVAKGEPEAWTRFFDLDQQYRQQIAAFTAAASRAYNPARSPAQPQATA